MKERKNGISTEPVLVVALVLLISALGGLSTTAAGTSTSTSGCDNPPGTCNVNADTGCPDARPMQVSSGQHCVPLPANLEVIITNQTGGGCVGNDYLLVQLPSKIATYEAVWVNQYGSRWWSSPGTTWPNSVTGEGGVTYPVPNGYAAWSVGGGASAAGHCSSPPGGTDVLAWGVTSLWAVSGTIIQSGSVEPAPGISVEGDCTGGGDTTTTNEQGQYVLIVGPGQCNVTPQPSNGLQATPQNRSFDVQNNVGNVNFEVLSGAGLSTASSSTSASTSAPSTPSPIEIALAIAGVLAVVGGLGLYRHQKSGDGDSPVV
jgi:hypothetical protein